MADDHRHSWLDDDAMERLLRGEPADAHGAGGDRDDSSRAERERLAAVLDVVAAVGGPSVGAPVEASAPLPGEEAAVAAFRAGRSVPPEGSGGAGRSHQRGPWAMRVIRGERPVGSPFPEAFGGPSRLRRPVRLGVVGVLAGCVLGSVAVASGAGGLPTPFGEDDTPRPRVTMPGVAGDPSTSPHASESASQGASGSPDNDASDGPRGADSGKEAEHQAEQTDKTGKKPDEDPPFKRHKGKWVIALCHAYLEPDSPAGRKLDEKARRKIEEKAGGPEAARTFCNDAIAKGGGYTPHDPGDSDGSGGSGGGSGGQDGGSEGGHNGGQDGGGNGGPGDGQNGGPGDGQNGGSEGGQGGSDSGTGSPPPPGSGSTGTPNVTDSTLVPTPDPNTGTPPDPASGA